MSLRGEFSHLLHICKIKIWCSVGPERLARIATSATVKML
jgi:hypothetical protein